MPEEPTQFSKLLAGYGTTHIGDDMRVESVCALLKLRAEDGSASWAVRSGGVPLSKEELVGVLDGLVSSIERRLMKSWKGTLKPSPPGKPIPIQFSDLLAGMDTMGLADEFLIESVFAVIKARRSDNSAVWHVRSAEMRLSPQELLGALDGYAASLRDDLAESWKW